MAQTKIKLPTGEIRTYNLPDGATPDQIEEFLNAQQGPDKTSAGYKGTAQGPVAAGARANLSRMQASADIPKTSVLDPKTAPPEEQPPFSPPL